MSTRSTITLSTKDGYKSIYCHFDGHLDSVGKTLIEHYNTQEAVEELIELGSLSQLNKRAKPDADEKHQWGSPAEGVTVAYHRDRGERLVIVECETLKELSRNFVEYNYVFENDKWSVVINENRFVSLKDALAV